jgi:hypothetical protein
VRPWGRAGWPFGPTEYAHPSFARMGHPVRCSNTERMTRQLGGTTLGPGGTRLSPDKGWPFGPTEYAHPSFARMGHPAWCPNTERNGYPARCSNTERMIRPRDRLPTGVRFSRSLSLLSNIAESCSMAIAPVIRPDLASPGCGGCSAASRCACVRCGH